MSIRIKTALLVIAGAAILLGASVLLISPLLVNHYRPNVISYLQEKLGKQVEIGRLTLTMFPVSIRLDDFGVKNAPPFPPGYVVKIARVDAELDARAPAAPPGDYQVARLG